MTKNIFIKCVFLLLFFVPASYGKLDFDEELLEHFDVVDVDVKGLENCQAVHVDQPMLAQHVCLDQGVQLHQLPTADEI